MKIKISRRESKEAVYWLNLVITYNDEMPERERLELIDERTQIRKILSSILKKTGVI